MNPAEVGIEAGTILAGKYRIESVIGRGGMGLVYRAHHLTLDETIAIKVLRRDVSLDEETVARFVREAQSAVRLKSEHVARIRDVGTFDDGLPYMVMEFLEGADLGQLVETNGALNVPVAIDLVLQSCDAIVEAHSLGIVHRDIKPSNLFLSFRPDNTAIVKVLDFGISKSATGADLSLTQTSSMLGTPAYMSPEQMRSARKVDARTDVWSIGTVLYELVEGRRPFNAESFSEMCVMVAMDPPAAMVLAPELEPVILRCLAKHPDQRYANVADLMQDLARFAGSPDAARHFITRAYRVLGLPVPRAFDSSPAIRAPVTYLTPVPAMSLGALVRPGAATAPTMTTEPRPAATMAATAIRTAPPRPRRTTAVLAVLCVLLGVGGAVGYVVATGGEHGGAGSDATGATTTDDTAGSSAAGSSATGSNAESGAGAGSSTAATDVGSNATAGSNAESGAAAGAGSSMVATDVGSSAGSSAGSGTPRAGSATVANTGAKPPRGGGKPPRGGGKPPRGAGTGSASSGKGSAVARPPDPVKPKCDPFASRRDGCS